MNAHHEFIAESCLCRDSEKKKNKIKQKEPYQPSQIYPYGFSRVADVVDLGGMQWPY